MNIYKKQKLMEFLQITLGIVLIVFGFYFFFSPSGLVTGGVTGLSIVYKKGFNASATSVSIFIFVANIILLIIGGLLLGKDFFLKTVYGTLFLPILTLMLSVIKVPSDLILSNVTGANKLLISAISGAVFSGIGLGLVFKNNATTGGTDVVQKIFTRKFRISYSVALYIIDGSVILLGLAFYGIESTFYAILALSITGTVIDRIMLSGKSGYTVFIVTTNYDLVKTAIFERIRRGITKVPVYGGYSENANNMIICTISKNQLYYLKNIIQELDPNAFTFVTKTVESVGQGFSSK